MEEDQIGICRIMWITWHTTVDSKAAHSCAPVTHKLLPQINFEESQNGKSYTKIDLTRSGGLGEMVEFSSFSESESDGLGEMAVFSFFSESESDGLGEMAVFSFFSEREGWRRVENSIYW